MGTSVGSCLAILASALLSTGCFSGAVYTHVTTPLDVNLDRTPFHRGERDDSWKTLRIPLGSGFFIQIDWGSDGIADAARARGMEKVYYADLETIQVLGVWRQRWAVVYGE